MNSSASSHQAGTFDFEMCSVQKPFVPWNSLLSRNDGNNHTQLHRRQARCGLLEASHSAILRATTVGAPRSPIPATPLHIATVVDHVYAALREGILDGTLAHGT